LDRHERYLQNLLGRGVYPRKELFVRLRRKGCERSTTEALLNRYEELGLIDDRAYAILFVDGHPDWSVRRIRDELRSRGIPSDFILEAIEEADIDEEERAVRLAEGWRSVGIEPRKIEGRLFRRGFPGDVVYRALGDDVRRYDRPD
jgi:regulatory protein